MASSRAILTKLARLEKLVGESHGTNAAIMEFCPDGQTPNGAAIVIQFDPSLERTTRPHRIFNGGRVEWLDN